MSFGNWRPRAEAGVVSLITSIIVGLLLVVITSSAIAVTGGELRQATDYDNSIKAYYAAESGAEDALAEVRRGLTKTPPDSIDSLAKPTCEPYDAADAALATGISYTCQLVELDTTQLTDQLQAEQSRQLDLSGAPAFNKIVLQWNQRGNSSDPQSWVKASIPPAADSNGFPIGSSWFGVYPAVMQVTVVSYPNTANFNSSDIISQTAVFKPAPSGGVSSVDLSVPATLTKPVLTNCNPGTVTGTYDCSMTINGFKTGAGGATPSCTSASGCKYVMRLHARYSPGRYQIEAFNGITKITLPRAQLGVDVTGRAGDVYRRIRLTVPLNGSSPNNFALMANETICKVQEILEDSAITGGQKAQVGC